MFPGLPRTLPLTIAIALLPAGLRWWWGRSLARRPDDPLIAERLVAHSTRVQATTFACTMLLLIDWPFAALWSAPLLVVASSAAAFSLRKALYNETWTRRQSLSFHIRLSITVFGFWLLLGVTPWVSQYAGDHQWMAGVALGALLAAWNHYYVDVMRAILRAQPVTDGTLNERFTALVARSGIEMPRFEFV